MYRVSTVTQWQALTSEILRRTTLIYMLDDVDIFLNEVKQEVTGFQNPTDYAAIFIEDTQDNNKDLLALLEQHHLNMNDKQTERIICIEDGSDLELETIDWLCETYLMCNQHKLVIVRPRTRLSQKAQKESGQEERADV